MDNPNPTPQVDQTANRVRAIASALLVSGALMFALIVVGSFLVINRLGQVHFVPLIGVERDVVDEAGKVISLAPPPPAEGTPEAAALEAKRNAYRVIAAFVALTTTGIPTLLTLVLIAGNQRLLNGAKAVMRIVTMVWAILVTILCLFSFAMDFGADILAGFDSILNIAPAIFAMIGGLNLIAVVAVLLVSFTGSEEHTSVSGAVGGIMVWMSEFVLALAGFGFEAYYGIAIGIQPLVASLAAMLMSGGFVMSLAKLHDSRRRRDEFDKRVWAVVSVVFVAYIGIVGATAGAHLSEKEGLIPKFILDIGERAFFFSQATLALVLWVAKIWTDRIDWIEPDPNAPVTVTTPGRPALPERAVGSLLTLLDSYAKAKAAWDTAKDATRDTSQPKSLPEPTGVPLNNEQPERVSRTEDAGPKQ